MFKQATGYTPHVYITSQRVERAQELLRDTHIPLGEIGARVGFETQSHFTGVFHRYAGVTPRAFRLGAQSGKPAQTPGESATNGPEGSTGQPGSTRARP
jgi:AraC family transcriptional regulator